MRGRLGEGFLNVARIKSTGIKSFSFDIHTNTKIILLLLLYVLQIMHGCGDERR